ncbi:PREDICTED: iduronate 2-sulfatase [Nicrophorus vespilloides]|uniref:Iduronate 2-sulfatase n=1 Tax=Nicrophorus vespilloides TaxID=110193 RepID=A0ABM1MF69_NICVS|nr:PREDICTED: iduronate 2-sulfatase [Nicrophorus vespilloides]
MIIMMKLLLFMLLSHVLVDGRKPNVLFIVVDDLRPSIKVFNDDNAYTPNLDILAQKSFIFHNAFAQQALCGPSRTSFLTSRRPDSLHLYDVHSYWRHTVGNFTTIPQHFKENGYMTHSIGKVFHPGVVSNYTDDFQYSWSFKPFHPVTDKYKNSRVCVNRYGHKQANIVCPVRIEDQPKESLPDIETLNAGLKFLQRKWSKPYFLAVGFQKPHIPLKYPRKYLDYHPLNKVTLPKNRQRPSDLPNVAWNPWLDVKSRDDVAALNISFPFGMMPDNFSLLIKQSYMAATTYIDDLIGKLLTEIDDNTIVVIFGDHGFSLGEHGEFAKYSNFDVATRVPLIIHVPKWTETLVQSKELVELVDLFPTLVDLTQISPSLDTCSEKETKLCTEGISLVPHMIDLINNKTEKVRKRAIFTQYPRPGIYPSIYPNSDQPKLTDIQIMGYSIRTSLFRYTEWVEFDNSLFLPNWSKVYAIELYCHQFDKAENINLSNRPQMKHIMRRLRKQLIRGWRDAVDNF